MLGPDLLRKFKIKFIEATKAQYPAVSEAIVVDIFDNALKSLLMDEAETDVDRRIASVVGVIST